MVDAGWFDDPTGRHQLRFWDGHGWTEHVTDNSVPSSDPVAEQVDSPVATGATDQALVAESADEVLPGGPSNAVDRETTKRRWPWLVVGGVVVALLIAGGIAAAVSSDDKAKSSESFAPDSSSDDTQETFATTTTTAPKPVVHHIGDVISYTVDATGDPYGSVQVFSFNPNAPCTESFGCSDFNDGSAIAAVDIQVCATGSEAVPYNTLGVKIVTSDNRQWDESAIGGPKPDLGSGDVSAGTCKRGFANLKAPPAGSAPITGILWDYAGFPATTIVP